MTETAGLNICISKPNGINYSETFIDSQVNLLPGNKKVVYGGFFPLFGHQKTYLIQSRSGLLEYLIRKRIFHQKEIRVRTRAFARYLGENNIEVVLAEYGLTGALIRESCELSDVPMVIHFHGFDAHVKSVTDEYAELYRKAFAFASRIIAVSKPMQASLIELGASPKKIVLLPYGVDTSLFKQNRPSENPLVFLSVARFAEKKSPLSTLSAFAKVLVQFPQARLKMAGIGPLWEQAKASAEQLGISSEVEFLGVQTPLQVAALMRKARVFVQHSVIAPGGDSEGTPNSILEAAASCLPVVSTFHAGIPEAVLHEHTGLLVREHDVEGMARYMCRLAADPVLCDQMGFAARRHMEQNYHMQVQIGKLAAILNEVVKEHRSLNKRNR